jgi:hypothetical protein
MADAPKQSKNDPSRRARRTVQRKHHCARGHVLVRVLVAPVRGPARFHWWCACDGLLSTDQFVKQKATA